MGTYTTNYNLFMPTVGEQGWGTLVNGNFTTIDTTMKGLDTRLTAVESEVNGALSCTSVTTSGKVTGNGGIVGTTGTFSGAVSGTKFIRSSNISVTCTTPSSASAFGNKSPLGALNYYCILPYSVKPYNGNVIFKNVGTNATAINYVTSFDTLTDNISNDVNGGATYTLNLSNAKCLYVKLGTCVIGNITLS